MQLTPNKYLMAFFVGTAAAVAVWKVQENKSASKVQVYRPAEYAEPTGNSRDSVGSPAMGVPADTGEATSFAIFRKGEDLTAANVKVREMLSQGRPVLLPSAWAVADLPPQPQPLPAKPPAK